MRNDSDENQTAENSEANEFKIFNSFSDAEDEMNRWLASLTPDQHLQNAVKLIKRLYSKQLETNTGFGNNFKID